MAPVVRSIPAAGVLVALATAGCPDPGKAARERAALPDPRTDTRFVQIRNMLSEETGSATRAQKLYPLVEPVCTDEAEREAFVEVARWSVSHSVKENQLPAVLAADTIEHVATACARNHPRAALDLLTRAEAAIPKEPRIPVVRARLLAARGRFDDAVQAAQRGIEKGSIHAIALTANIQARRARDQGVGYRSGMLDDAIETVSAEPTPDWPAIDLAAVLSTRARLLMERAFWEDEDEAERTRLEAASLLQRLSVAPFIYATRERSLDVLCFDAVARGKDPYDACRRAAEATRNLGAARAVGMKDPDPEVFETERLVRLEALAGDVEQMKAGSVVLLVMRGDESEILEWARPAVRVLARLEGRDVRWVVVDRTDTARAEALMEAILDRAEVEPTLAIDASDENFAMACVSAILADRQAPKSCPLEDDAKEALRGMDTLALAVLVGRDLDAEIDDLRTYDLRTALLSFRRSRFEEGIDAWLKSISDAWIVAPPEDFGSTLSR